MSTITKEFTKEHLQQIIETDHVQCGEASALARIALASLEAEAVGEVIEQQSGMMLDGLVISEKPTYRNIKGIHNMKMMPLGTKFYTAPPAPVVPAPTSNSSSAFEDFWSNFEHPFAEDDELKSFASEIYRAAMLQGAEPVSNSDELPLDYLQGHKDGLEWAAQLAEANHPQTGDWLYDDPIDLAREIRKGPDMPTVQGGNSPVIPDDVRRMDWLVSKTVDVREPMVYGSHSLFWSQTITDEEDDYHATKLREQIDAAMAAEQAAAPQQEAE